VKKKPSAGIRLILLKGIKFYVAFFCLFYHKCLIYGINAFYCLYFLCFSSYFWTYSKYYCSFLLLNLGLHSHMLVLNYRQNWKHRYWSLVGEKEGGSGFYDKQIFAIVCHCGSLRRAEEAVYILFARVLLLLA